MYSGYGIASDGLGSWSFGDDFARNVMIFGVDSSLPSHSNNCKNNFLVLCEGPTDHINIALVQQRKSLILILVKERKNFALVYITMVIIIIFFVNGKEI